MRRRDIITMVGTSAVARPFAARAQQPAIPVIGFVSSRSPADSATLVIAFRKGLSAWFKEPDVVIEYRWAEGDYDRLPVLVADLLTRKIAVLVTVGGEPSALAAKAATSTVPIVFIVGEDPVKLGLVQSFSRPGGNATGFNLFTAAIEAKRLGLLYNLVPDGTTFGVLLNPKILVFTNQARELQEAAHANNRRIESLFASNNDELEEAFESLAAKRIDGLLVTADPFFDMRLNRIVDLIAGLRVPAIFQSRNYALAGGLVSYGISFPEIYRQAGDYAGRILRGANPAELPVVQPVKFELVVNLKTAATLGFTVPVPILAQANEVIE
jgi:putative tryptophan/tyrosine transport system substrate-binding protein